MALIPYGEPYSWAIWFGLAPWVAVTDRSRSSLGVVWFALFCSAVFSFQLVHEVVPTLHAFFGKSHPISWFFIFFYAPLSQLQLIIVGLFRRWTRPLLSPTPHFLATALLYSGVDWLLPKITRDTLGSALIHHPYFSQAADLGGVHLLTFVLVCSNLAVWEAVYAASTRGPWRLPIRHGAIALSLLALTLGYGAWRLHGNWGGPILGNLRVAIVQPGHSRAQLQAAESGVDAAVDTVLDDYLRLSEEALAQGRRADLLVWPEGAYPTTFLVPKTRAEEARAIRLETWLEKRGIQLFFGAQDEGDARKQNVALLHGPETDDLQLYSKGILFPFGEYLPGVPIDSPLLDELPNISGLEAGSGAKILNVRAPWGKVPINPIICYESLFPEYHRAGVLKGSQLILNITNDSWFGTGLGPQIHLEGARYRSIETRLPQIRAALTGVSAVIDSRGRVVTSIPVGARGFRVVDVPIEGPAWTLFRAWGEWFAPTALLLTLGCVGVIACRRYLGWAEPRSG